MGGESLEVGLLPRSSVPETNSTTNSTVDGDSSATPIVILSTLVSICGSFAFGCTVSTIIISLSAKNRGHPSPDWFFLTELIFVDYGFAGRIFLSCWICNHERPATFFGSSKLFLSTVKSQLHTCTLIHIDYGSHMLEMWDMKICTKRSVRA